MAERTSSTELRSWSPGPTRDAVTSFLEASQSVAVEDRVAVLDNDGTLWCERPSYIQQAFIAAAFENHARQNPDYTIPDLAAAIMSGGMGAASGASLSDLSDALNDVFVGLNPEEFASRVQAFVRGYTNPLLGNSGFDLRYQPMLELLDALRDRQFEVFIVTGGGAAFVQAISEEAYGVAPHRVIGTLVDYEYDDDPANLRRTSALVGEPNEGFEKVRRIQQIIGRRPIFAAGNSAGDADMLQYTQGADVDSLAILINHDDDTREVSYDSVAATFDDTEPLAHLAATSGWQVVSMRDDWDTVFTNDSARP